MKGFQVTLRDVFILVTALCVQLAIVALYFQLPEPIHQWSLVTGLRGVSIVAFPLLLAIVVSDFRRHLPLLSALVAFASVETLYTSLSTLDPIQLATFFFLGNTDLDRILHSLALWNVSVLLSLVSAWITRSLLPRPSTLPAGPAPS